MAAINPQPAHDFGKPFLLMSAGDHSAPSDPSWQQFLNNHRSWSLQLHLPAGEHFTYTDYQALLPQLVAQLGLNTVSTAPFIGSVNPVRSIASQRAYLTAYFDEHLRHQPQRLLDGPPTAPRCAVPRLTRHHHGTGDCTFNGVTPEE